MIFFVCCEVMTRFMTDRIVIFDMEMHKYATSLKDYTHEDLDVFTHFPKRKLRLMGADVYTDSWGLRSSGNSGPRLDGKTVAVLGDSFTFGWGVDYDSTFVGVLNQKMIGMTFVNFGHCNYNTEQSVKHYRFLTGKLRPKKVFLFYFLNDAEPTPEKNEPSVFQRSRFLALLWSRIRILSNSISYSEYYENLYKDDQPGWLNSRKFLIELKKETDEAGQELIVFLLPELRELTPYRFSNQHHLIIDFLEKNGIEVHDLAPAFAGMENPSDLWVARDDPHPNKKAHAIIAEKVQELVRERNE